MSYKIVITDTAKQDLWGIARYIVEREKSKDTAQNFISSLKAKTLDLQQHQRLGALPKDRILKSLGYRYLVHKDYLLFYLIDEEAKIINVVAIFNSKKDYMRVLKGIF